MLRTLVLAPLVIVALHGCRPAPEVDPLFSDSGVADVTAEDVADFRAAAQKTEADPVFAASAAAAITTADVANWNAAEADPAFAASAAAAITTADLANWNAAEVDPTFTASPAAAITAADIANWNLGAPTETDPLFGASVASAITAADVATWNGALAASSPAGGITAANITTWNGALAASSPAGGITATNVSDWNGAVAWGNHATAGYTRQSGLVNNSVARWNGAELVPGLITNTTTGVGISTTTPAATLDVRGVLRVGTKVSTTVNRQCAIGGFNYTDTRAGTPVCEAYCQGLGHETGFIVESGSKTCAGASCSYVSDYASCTIATRGNDGFCGCAANYDCRCGTTAATQLRGFEASVDGYLRLGTVSAAPAATDCNSPVHYGRMKFNPANNTLYVCGTTGWVNK